MAIVGTIGGGGGLSSPVQISAFSATNISYTCPANRIAKLILTCTVGSYGVTVAGVNILPTGLATSTVTSDRSIHLGPGQTLFMNEIGSSQAGYVGYTLLG